MFSTKILLFLAAFAVCTVFTAIVSRWAPRLGLVDKPDARRKMHGRSMPLGGGIAISAALTLCIGTLALFPNSLRPLFNDGTSRYVAYVLAALVLLTVGLVDDRVRLRGGVKMTGQILAALILIAGGLVIRSIAIFGLNIHLGLFSIPFTLFWLLGAINALNLLDGMDGMAGTIGLILVSAIAVMAHLTHSWDVEVVAIAFAGCLVGFLRYNLPPARVFLGDAGSMLIGLVVGALAIEASLKGPGTVLLAAPLAICTVPILDSFAAVVRRKLTGRSIFSADRGHLHHHLMNRLGCSRRALGRVALICAATAFAALASVFMHNDLVALVTCLAVVGIMVATDTFGRAETLLLVKRFGRLGRSMIVPATNGRRLDSSSTIRLQGTRPWDTLWQSLAEAGEKYGLVRIYLDINIPSIHESFAAIWRGGKTPDPDFTWTIDMPLKAGDRLAGRLSVTGRRGSETPQDELEGLMEVLQGFEARMTTMICDGPDSTPDPTDMLVAVGGPIPSGSSRQLLTPVP